MSLAKAQDVCERILRRWMHVLLSEAFAMWRETAQQRALHFGMAHRVLAKWTRSGVVIAFMSLHCNMQVWRRLRQSLEHILSMSDQTCLAKSLRRWKSHVLVGREAFDRTITHFDRHADLARRYLAPPECRIRRTQSWSGIASRAKVAMDEDFDRRWCLMAVQYW